MVGGAEHRDVETVAVPVFGSNSFRRGLEFQLTEAVQRHIKTRTRYRLAEGAYADTRLTGNIVEVSKRGLGMTAGNDPRELQLQYAVEVAWEDLRSGRTLGRQTVPVPPDLVHLVSQAEFAPEVGQSLATSNQEAVNQIARQIVEMMEAPW